MVGLPAVEGRHVQVVLLGKGAVVSQNIFRQQVVGHRRRTAGRVHTAAVLRGDGGIKVVVGLRAAIEAHVEAVIQALHNIHLPIQAVESAQAAATVQVGVGRVQRERVRAGVIAVRIQYKLTIRAIGRGQGAGGDNLVQHVHVRVLFVGERIQRIRPNFHPAPDFLVEGAAQRIALKALHRHNTRLVVVAQRGRILRVVTAAAHSQRVVLDVPFLQQLALVVGGIASVVVGALIRGQERGRGGVVHPGGRGGPVGFELVVVVLLTVLNVKLAVGLLHAVVAAVCGFGRTAFAPTSGDEDNAVGPTSTINGRR